MGQISKRYQPWEWSNFAEAKQYLIQNCEAMFTPVPVHEVRMVETRPTPEGEFEGFPFTNPFPHGETTMYRFEDYSVELGTELDGHVKVAVWGLDHYLVREGFTILNGILTREDD